MSGQFRKDPFYIRNDSIFNNVNITNSLNLSSGAEIRASDAFAQFATADLVNNAATIQMPMNGIMNMFLTVTTGTWTLPATITVNNPYVSGEGYPVALISGPNSRIFDSVSTVPGKIIITIANDSDAIGMWQFVVGSNSLPPTEYSY